MLKIESRLDKLEIQGKIETIQIKSVMSFAWKLKKGEDLKRLAVTYSFFHQVRDTFKLLGKSQMTTSNLRKAEEPISLNVPNKKLRIQF